MEDCGEFDLLVCETTFKRRSYGGFTQYPFFVRLFIFLLLHEKVRAFSFFPRFYMFVFTLARVSHTEQKFSEKNFL